MIFIYSTYSIRVVVVHYGQVLISLVKLKEKTDDLKKIIGLLKGLKKERISNP